MSGDIIDKYTHRTSEQYLLYFEEVEAFEDLPDMVQTHLISNRIKLEDRATVRNEGRTWWRYSRPLHKEYYQYHKIWCSYRAKDNNFCLDESDDYIGLTNTTVIFGNNDQINLKYVLALLNSRLLSYRYKSIGKQTGGGVFEYFENQVSKLPIPNIEIEKQEIFAALVDQILDSKRADVDANTSDTVDKIDGLVYRLFGLSYDDVVATNPGFALSAIEYEGLDLG